MSVSAVGGLYMVDFYELEDFSDGGGVIKTSVEYSTINSNAKQAAARGCRGRMIYPSYI